MARPRCYAISLDSSVWLRVSISNWQRNGWVDDNAIVLAPPYKV